VFSLTREITENISFVQETLDISKLIVNIKISGMKRVILYFAVLMLLGSCKKDDPQTDPKDNLYIYGEYTNYNGQAPTFTISGSETSPYIAYSTPDVQTVPTSQGNRIRIRIPNVKIKIDNTNYALTAVQVEEKKADGWAKQEEFNIVDISTKNKLAVAMVLDMSSSLGNDVTTVKSSANQFTNDFLNPGYGSLGLVLFSENITAYNFTTSASTTNLRINQYTDFKNATTLYGAMYKGIQMLDTFSAPVDKKILLTFTDGGDNNTNNPTTVRSNILNSNYERYIIGLRGKGGDYIESDLKSLVQKPENFIGADNINSVNQAFNSIYKSLTTTSVIQYFRTTQTFTLGVDPPIKVRLKLTVQ
jgi:hypothetical protein